MSEIKAFAFYGVTEDRVVDMIGRTTDGLEAVMLMIRGMMEDDGPTGRQLHGLEDILRGQIETLRSAAVLLLAAEAEAKRES